jgi:hypothetical protein
MDSFCTHVHEFLYWCEPVFPYLYLNCLILAGSSWGRGVRKCEKWTRVTLFYANDISGGWSSEAGDPRLTNFHALILLQQNLFGIPKKLY